MTRLTLVALLLTTACSEYELDSKLEPEALPPETETTPPEVVVEPEPEVSPSCADVPLDGWRWYTDSQFDSEPDPTDLAGTAFWQVGFDRVGFSEVWLPTTDIAVGMDRVYLGEFELTELPVNLMLNLQSDDGTSVWVNGTFLGHWGGLWQEEGCVNENAQCLVTESVSPIDVTELLVVGTNVVATRVSNAIENAYFEVIPECVE